VTSVVYLTSSKTLTSLMRMLMVEFRLNDSN